MSTTPAIAALAVTAALRDVPGSSVTPVRDAVIVTVADTDVTLTRSTLQSMRWAPVETTPCGNGRTALRLPLAAFAS